MSIALICVALLGLLLFVLGFNVSMVRGTTRANYGSEQNPECKLYKARRAHGNTAEYAPMLAVMMLVLSQQAQPSWVIWSMVLATFFRYLFVAGILFPATMAKPNPMRFLGALGTYLTGLALAVAVGLQATGA